MKGVQAYYVIVYALVSTLCTHNALLAGENLLIIDTAERDAFLYQPTFQILQSVGYNPVYKSLDALIDQTPSRLALAKYKAVFFVLGIEFLKSLSSNTHLGNKVLRLLDQYAHHKGVKIGLVFPSIRVPVGTNLLASCAPLFHALGVTVPPGALLFSSPSGFQAGSHNQSASSFLYTANIFLTNPLETRPVAYHTTLSEPHAGVAFDTEQISDVLSQQGNPLYLLPMHAQCTDVIKATLPYGLYWFNPLRKNHVFITTTSLMTFAGITENFHVCPANHDMRLQMLTMVQRMFFEWACLTKFNEADRVCKAVPELKIMTQPALPITYTKNASTDAASAQKIAWMEICKQTPEQQKQLVEYILQSKLTALWITINPQMYYSTIARLKDKKDEFLAELSRFTKLLSDVSQERSCPAPGILVGYEITNNVYEPNMPKHHKCAVDMYHNVYPDLPAPVDTGFWQSEITEPLKGFAKAWQKPEVSHGIKLAGIVLDLEMYCRKKTGTFSTLMGFDGLTFKAFTQQKKIAQNSTPLKDRVLTLMNHHCAGDYFNFLESKAASIGADIAATTQRLIPNGVVLCYMPNLHISWFYKGLCKGLATRKDNPLMLLTFNSEFNAHKDWFTRNKISATHASVLMLSKVKTDQDFGWVDDIVAHHQGIWFNRFSRFIEPKAKDWTSVEQPMMAQEDYGKFLGYVARF